MSNEELKNKIIKIQNKYKTRQHDILNYDKELTNAFYEYADKNEDYDYEFEKIFNDVISGEDCIGLVMGAKSNSLYYWKNVDGKTVVEEVDYDLLTKLSNDALKCYEKSKDKEADFDIC